MKKLLFVINSLTIGGSEKSLVSLLNLIDFSKYNVDLLMLKTGEGFDKYIPEKVDILPIPRYYAYLNDRKLNISLMKKIKFKICRYKCSIKLKLNGKLIKIKNNQQIFYENQKNLLESLDKKYDVAIAYAQGFPTYFIVDKVNANKKIAWINCDYTATAYDKKLDKLYYDKIDKIIAVSDAGKKSIINVNRDYEKKIEVIKDIVNPELIETMSKESITELNIKELKIITVARLVEGYKGYDLAIKAAKLLNDEGYKFKWYAIGEGPDRDKIKKLILENKIDDKFILLGSRDNPYPYMRACDIYVQPSRAEGFGLTVIEAKILKKPIVCTNFSTSKELIKHGVDGLIVDINEKSILNGIKSYINNIKIKDKILENLNNQTQYNTINEMDKFYELINNY